MLQCILSASRIQRVAVRQERAAALFLADVGDTFCILRAQVREVAELAEMHLDGDELVLHVDVLDASGQAEAAELVRDARADGAAEIGEPDFRFAHVLFLLQKKRFLPSKYISFSGGCHENRKAARMSTINRLCRRLYII